MKQYYLKQFEIDLRAFIGDSPVPYFGHAWNHNCGKQLSRVPAENRTRFLICLYFTVLVDQAMHAHYRTNYLKFEMLTRYPKFCHGLSQFQHNPRGILKVPVEQGIVSSFEMVSLLAEGMALFVDQVIAFFSEHMREIDPREFFESVLYDHDVQIPELSVLVDPSLKDDVVCVAYNAMRNAVARAFAG